MPFPVCFIVFVFIALGELDEFAVEDMAENRAYIDTIEEDYELCELFDELEEDESEAA